MNEKKIYKPIQNDCTAYAKIIFAFIAMYRKYRNNEISVNDTNYVNALYNLASVIVASVLKKIYDDSCNKTIESYRRENDLATLANTKYCVENATETHYNKKGKLVTDIVDTDLYIGIHENIDKGLSERSVMVENVVCDIISYCAKIPLEIVNNDYDYKPGDGKIYKVNFLTRPITTKHLNRRIYVCEVLSTETENSKIIVEEKTSLLQLFHKRLRRYIDNNDTKCEVARKYVYLDKEYTDNNGNTYMYYERYLGYDFKFNVNDSYSKGHKDLECGDKSLYEFNEIVKLLNLTPPQKKVLECRMKNGGRYGVKSISTMTGIPVNSVKSALREIRNKAVKFKIVPPTENYIDKETAVNTEINLEKMNDVSIGLHVIDNIYAGMKSGDKEHNTAVNVLTAKSIICHEKKVVDNDSIKELPYTTKSIDYMTAVKLMKCEKIKLSDKKEKHTYTFKPYTFHIEKDFKPININTLIRINYRKKKGYDSKCKDVSSFKANCNIITNREYEMLKSWNGKVKK